MGVLLAVMLQDFLRDPGSEDYDVRERVTAARRFRGSLVPGFSGSEADDRPESGIVVVPALMEPETQALLRDLGAEDYDVRERATAVILEMEPDDALPIVRRAIGSRDCEVNARGRALLREMAARQHADPRDWLKARGFRQIGGVARPSTGIERGGRSGSLSDIVDINGDGIPDIFPRDCPSCGVFTVDDAFGVPMSLCNHHHLPGALALDSNDFSGIRGPSLMITPGGTLDAGDRILLGNQPSRP